MARGDLEIRTFQIRSPDGQGGSEPFIDELDEIFLTAKKNFNDRNYKFQKRYTSGDIVPLGNGVYQFRIEPSDTDGLAFGEYDFDIELLIEGELKKTFTGKLILTAESTHAYNEVRA